MIQKIIEIYEERIKELNKQLRDQEELSSLYHCLALEHGTRYTSWRTKRDNIQKTEDAIKKQLLKMGIYPL